MATSIKGLAAVFGNVDLGGDVIHKGAFAASIESVGNVPIYWEHEHGMGASETLPIGKTTALFETLDGLGFEGFVSATSRGSDVLVLLSDGVVSETSIGFNVPEGAQEFDENGIRHIFEIDLMEISIVTWGMNPLTISELASRGAPSLSSIFADELARLNKHLAR